MSDLRSPIVLAIVEQHAEGAALLWILRERAVARPDYLLRELIKLERRLEAHLDGLQVGGEPGWEIAKGQLVEVGGPGEVFAAAVLAFESGVEDRVRDVLEVGTATPEAARALVSALGWLTPEQASKHFQGLLDAASTVHRRIGIATSAVHRRNPGPALQAALASDDPLLKARALRAVGELGLANLRAVVEANLKDGDPACRFWAAWSAALLTGPKVAVDQLQCVAESGGPFRERAVRMAVRRLSPPDAGAWLTKLGKELGQLRTAVIGSGTLGVPEIVPWLIEQMNVPELARVAGEAFSMITGVHIAYNKLGGTKPEGFEAGPTEDPADEDVAMDPDENLSWPDPALVAKWWSARRGDFSKGTRYLIGRPIEPEALQQVLKAGYQRQRATAALELALLNPGHPLFEVRAPGFRQLRLLA